MSDKPITEDWLRSAGFKWHEAIMTAPKLTPAQRRALEAVAAGAVMHAHPFTWAVEPDWLDVKPRTLKWLTARVLIAVVATDAGYWRPVRLTDAGRRALAQEGGRDGE